MAENVKQLARNVHMHLGRKETQLAAAAVCGYAGKKATGSVNWDRTQQDKHLALLDNEDGDVRFWVATRPPLTSQT